MENTNSENIEAINTDISANAYYPDIYYDDVIDKLSSIEENQQTIIYNQEQFQLNFKENLKGIQNGIDVLVFLVGVFSIYTLIRNSLHR